MTYSVTLRFVLTTTFGFAFLGYAQDKPFDPLVKSIEKFIILWSKQ